VQVIKKDHVGKAFQVLQSFSVLGKYLGGTRDAGFSLRLDGHAHQILESCMDNTNG
jgi:hypothetical protein